MTNYKLNIALANANQKTAFSCRLDLLVMWLGVGVEEMRGENQCKHCYKFFKWEEADAYTPFGCATYDPPTPFDPTDICKECSEELKKKFIKQFNKGNYKCGDWQKSRAEIEAAKECGLVWISNNSNIEYNGKRAFNEYIPKEVYENANAQST